MESLQTVRGRINNIITTKQITHSMRLMSTIKAQNALRKMEANRPFGEQTAKLLRNAAAALPDKRHIYINPRETAALSAVVVISGDRGLCGSYGANVGKAALSLIESIGKTKLITVGAKARDYFKRRFKNKIERSFTGISENPFFDDAGEIASLLLDWYKSGEIGQVFIVYTQFETMLSQQPKAVKLLPIETVKIAPREAPRCETGAEHMLNHIVPYYINAFIYGAILESSVCEQCARASSMDSAIKNSEEMIEKLTLLYNQARQASVTQDLIEIVNGSDAVS